MVQMQTYLKVADNTGAKELMCFSVLGGTNTFMHIFTASLTACIQRRDALHPEMLRGLAFEKRKAARCSLA